MENNAPYAPKLTLDELLALESDLHRLELSSGCLVREPPAGQRHGTIAMTVGAALFSYAQATGLGRVFTCDTGFVLARDPDTVRGPDVAFVRAERCAQSLTTDALFEGPPDLAVEVLSPSDRKAGIERKLADYRRASTPLVWLVEPRSCCVTEVLAGTRKRFGLSEVLTAPQLLPGFELPVARVFE